MQFWRKEDFAVVKEMRMHGLIKMQQKENIPLPTERFRDVCIATAKVRNSYGW